jgi:hypothetical protein
MITDSIVNMNPFEYFQELKPEIMKDESFMDILRTYAFTDRLRLIGNNKVTSLGAGRHNIHFRIGKVGDIWLATREYLEAIELADDLQHCENYIDAVVRAYEEGKRVPFVCGGVRAENGHGGRYFLLLEDLTQGGTADFQPAPKSGGISGILDGEEVFHDFDTDTPFHPPTKYLAEEKLLVLER